MIETKKSPVDFETIEEFGPKTPIYRENLLRQLVRLASILILGLLMVQVVSDEFLKGFFSSFLIFFLMAIFLVGISVTFSQLRWVNEQRNKSTNLGGSIGLFGLVITLLASLLSFVSAEFLSDIPILETISLPLLGLGLLLAVIGFCTEATRIDEPIVYWLKLNFWVIIRYSTTILGAFLFNWGILTIVGVLLVDWGVISVYIGPTSLVEGLVTGGGGGVLGILVVWGSWFHSINHTIWRFRVEILRTIELSISQVLIAFALLFPLYHLINDWPIPSILFTNDIILISGILGIALSYADLYIFKVKITNHFSRKFVTFGLVIASFIGCFLILFGILLSSHELLFTIFHPALGLLLLYRVWFDNINHFVKRSIQTIIWFSRTYYREIVTIFALGLMTLGSVIPLSLRVNLFEPVPLGLFFVGFILGVAIWRFPTRHAVFHGVTTSLSLFVFLWGVFLLSFLLGRSSTDPLSYLFSGTLMIVGVGVNGWIWRSEIYNSIKNTLIILKNTIVHTYYAIVHFLQTYYRELITLGALGFILYGLITWNDVFNFPHWPFLLLLIGYIVGIGIWYIPTRHDYFRGVTTTLSTLIVLFGFFLLFLRYYQPINWLCTGLVAIGVVVNGLEWRKELKQLIIQTALSIKSALVHTVRAIKNFFVAVVEAFIQAGRVFKQFIFDTLHATWDYRIVITRALMTFVGSVVSITSFVYWIYSLFQGLGIFRPELVFLLVGIVLLYAAWFYQVNRLTKQSAIAVWNAIVQTGHNLYNFLRNVKNALVKFLHTIWGYRIVILRALATIIGPLMILSDIIFVPFLKFTPEVMFGVQLILFSGGIGIFYIAWFHQINYFVSQSAIAIRNTIVQTARAIKNFFVATKDAFVKTVLLFIQFVDDTLHAIWKHRIDILRAFTTIIGFILVFIGLEPLFILIGVGLLYLAWIHQVNHIVRQSLLALRDAIVNAGQAFVKFVIDVKNAIVQAIRATVHFIHISIQYLWDRRIDILRAFTTIIGFFLVFIGFLSLFNQMYGESWVYGLEPLFILVGVGLLYLAWIHQVNHVVKQSLLALRDAIVNAGQAFVKFLIDVKNAIIKTVYLIRSFIKKAVIQLVRIFSAVVDSIIPIVFGTISLIVILYGFFVLIYTLIPSVGVALDEFFIQIPPVALIAELIQQKGYQGTLIGEFERMLLEGYRFFVIAVGSIFVIVGVMLLLLIVLKRESLYLKHVSGRIRGDSQ